MVDIKVVKNVLKLNDEVAAINRQALREHRIACIDLMGSPGAGKTALLETTLDRLREDLNVGVITGDIATTRDAERLAHRACDVTQINTGGSCHLDANQVRQGMANLNLDTLDLLIIENVGNLICPIGFDLGQSAKVGMFSVPEGEDKPAKHPRVVLECDLLLLNKIDLMPHIPFDHDVFMRDLHAIRGDARLIELSAVRGGTGFDAWCEWLRGLVAQAKAEGLASAPA